MLLLPSSCVVRGSGREEEWEEKIANKEPNEDRTQHLDACVSVCVGGEELRRRDVHILQGSTIRGIEI